MRPRWGVLGIVLAVGAAGCASRAARIREAQVQDAMKVQVFPVACIDLWPDALKLLAIDGYDLVGNDREVAGQSSQGGIARFLSAGHQTTIDERGALSVGTDWNKAHVRMRVTGTPDGPKACRVQATGLQEDLATTAESQWRDYDFEFALLERVAPAEADRIERQAAEAARK